MTDLLAVREGVTDLVGLTLGDTLLVAVMLAVTDSLGVALGLTGEAVTAGRTRQQQDTAAAADGGGGGMQSRTQCRARGSATKE